MMADHQDPGNARHSLAPYGVMLLVLAAAQSTADGAQEPADVSPFFRTSGAETVTEVCRYFLERDPLATKCPVKEPGQTCLEVVEGKEELLVRCGEGRDPATLCETPVGSTDSAQLRVTSVVNRTRVISVEASARELRLDPSVGLDRLVSSIAVRPGIEYVEPNCHFRIVEPDLPEMRHRQMVVADEGGVETAEAEDGAPLHCDCEATDPVRSEFDDPIFRAGKQWALDAMSAEDAWPHLANPDAPVVVAVMDTGVMLNHEDLADNVWQNPDEEQNGQDDDGDDHIDDLHGHAFYPADCWNPEASQTECDPEGLGRHGTQTTGVITATADNDNGIVGLHFGADFMSLRLVGPLLQFDFASVARTIHYAHNHGARILNISLGVSHPDVDGEVHKAIAEVGQGEDGLLLVIAAGNSRNNLCAASDATEDDADSDLFQVVKQDNMMFVMATRPYKRSDSSVVKESHSNFGSCAVDIAAPGECICTTRRVFDAGDTIMYTISSQTSIAAPHVSGAAAILLSMDEFKACPPERIREILVDHAHEVPVLAGDVTDTNRAGGTVDLHFLADPGLVESLACTGLMPAAPVGLGVH
jgi:hypothetical protein